MTEMMVSTRQTAAERRVAVLAAAITEFAKSGYAGTSTEAIAARAGISQPYLFRLFGTKKELFIATHDQVGDRIIKELTEASKGLSCDDAMHAMGIAYVATDAGPRTPPSPNARLRRCDRVTPTSPPPVDGSSKSSGSRSTTSSGSRPR